MKLHAIPFTKNAAYMAERTITPKGILVHSTGVNNPNLSRYTGTWNVYHGGGKDMGAHSFVPTPGESSKCKTCGGRQVCVHAFIGKQPDGKIATVQTLPWNRRAWHCGSGSKGSGNDTHISFEICEGDLTDSAYFNDIYNEAVELCAYLCGLYNLTEKDILCHSEAYKAGIASNHSDVMHWFPKHGKNMDTFRSDVSKILTVKNSMKTNPPSSTTSSSSTTPVNNTYPTLRKGDKGDSVKTMQAQLNKNGAKLVVDGSFGSASELAVKEYQKKNGLSVDGVCGPKTNAKLFS